MSNTVLILSEEFLTRIKVGLQEIQAKFANPVLIEIETQVKHAETAAQGWVSSIESHVAELKTKAEAAAKAVVNGVEKVG